MNHHLPPSPSSRHLHLDVARVVAIISITLNHAVSRSFNIHGGQMEDLLSQSLLFTLGKAMLYVFSRLGVPIFLMISGALLLSKRMENEHDIKRFYKHNLLNLFITAEIWYVIMYWFIVLFDPSNTMIELQGRRAAVLGMFKTMLFLDQTTMGSMWYMPMILCLYTTIPMVTIVKNKVPSPVLFLPVLLVYLNNMLLPAINTFLSLSDMAAFSGALSQANLLSLYYIYVILGYLIHQGKLEKMKDWLVILLILLSFGATCAYQIYAYSKPQTFNIYYDFPLLPICAGLIFEWVRRKAHWFQAARKPITYLAKIAFGIYFVHILIMSALVWEMKFSGWHPYLKFTFLEVVSFAGSILVIFVLSQIRVLRSRLFLIKD